MWVVKEQKRLLKIHKSKIQNGEIDPEFTKRLKKHSNICNKLIKKAVREKDGKNISWSSSVNDIWKNINDILYPDSLWIGWNIQHFFKEKVEKFTARIKKNPKVDPFLLLNEKMQGSNLKFKI